MTTLVTAPAAYPVSLADAKDHLRITGTEEDAYLSGLIGAATAVAEEITGRQLEASTYDLHLDAFPAGPVEIPRLPVLSVDSVTYTDANGVEQSLTDFEADTVNGRVAPAYGAHWPSTRAVPNAVRVRFTAGYPTGQAPFPIRCAILLLVGGLYENRESESPHKMHENETVGRLLWPYRVWR